MRWSKSAQHPVQQRLDRESERQCPTSRDRRDEPPWRIHVNEKHCASEERQDAHPERHAPTQAHFTGSSSPSIVPNPVTNPCGSSTSAACGGVSC